MTTVEDKLKLFGKIVFEKAQKDSEQKIAEFKKNSDARLESEKQNILKQSEAMIKQNKKKAEAKKNQVISKANIDRQHMLLKKRKEVYDRTVEDLKKLARNFTDSDMYMDYLEKTICNVLSKVEAKKVIMFFSIKDLQKSRDKIVEIINKYKKPDMEVQITDADGDILGGCICEDIEKTVRIDCSMASMLEDNKAIIGEALINSLK